MRIQAFVIFGLLMCGSLVVAVETEFWWEREPNFTLNYSKIPWVLRGVTPVLEHPKQLSYDEIDKDTETIIRLDPRTCPGEIAQCYQVRLHNFTEEITFGKNYTATSNYILPEKRIKMFVCIGNDTGCVETATNCFCLQQEVPKLPRFKGVDGCTDSTHLCRNSYASMTLCQGNLTWCREQYIACGCGPYATCTGSTRNTCVNDRNELFTCRGPLANCLKQYDTCFCGAEVMTAQEGCTTPSHACRTGQNNVTCTGQFAECAIRHDVCDC